MTILICRADEVEAFLQKHPYEAVLSIEHPNASEGRGRAPRLKGIDQKILSFWDIEQDAADGGPSEDIIKQAFAFIDQYNGKDIIVHCQGGRSRSVAIVLAWLSNREDISSAIDTIKQMREEAAPNKTVIKIADEMLGFKGMLLKAVLEDTTFQRNAALTERLRVEHLKQRQVSK